jgi:hypothetical protein
LTQPLNEAHSNIPDAPSLAPQSGTDKKLDGTEGTVEEQGGKKDSGKPSGLDKGALERNGEAGGTNTSPGPTVDEVRRFHKVQGEWKGHMNDGPQLDAAAVKERMEPHLQLM